MSGFWNRQKWYWIARIRKLKGTPDSIAVGVACGVAVSFTPFVGIHSVLALLSAWVLRGNIIAALLGTAVGNPWTFPFIWVSVLYTGRRILSMGYDDIIDVNFGEMFSRAFEALLKFDFDVFLSDIWLILYPMIVGCIPYVLISWWFSYVFIKNILKKRTKIVKGEV